MEVTEVGFKTYFINTFFLFDLNIRLTLKKEENSHCVFVQISNTTTITKYNVNVKESWEVMCRAVYIIYAIHTTFSNPSSQIFILMQNIKKK